MNRISTVRDEVIKTDEQKSPESRELEALLPAIARTAKQRLFVR